MKRDEDTVPSLDFYQEVMLGAPTTDRSAQLYNKGSDK